MHPSPSCQVARRGKGVDLGCGLNQGCILGVVEVQLISTFSPLPGVGPANKHKPWIEAEYQGIVMENDNTVLLNPPLFALDKDAPLRYAGTGAPAVGLGKMAGKTEGKRGVGGPGSGSEGEVEHRPGWGGIREEEEQEGE